MRKVIQNTDNWPDYLGISGEYEHPIYFTDEGKWILDFDSECHIMSLYNLYIIHCELANIMLETYKLELPEPAFYIPKSCMAECVVDAQASLIYALKDKNLQINFCSSNCDYVYKSLNTKIYGDFLSFKDIIHAALNLK